MMSSTKRVIIESIKEAMILFVKTGKKEDGWNEAFFLNISNITQYILYIC